MAIYRKLNECTFMYSVGESYCQSVAPVTWSEDDWSWSTHGNLLVVCTATDLQQWAAQNGANYGQWLRSVQALINAGDSAYDLSVKFSPCMCSYSSCSGWRNGCNLSAYAIPNYLWLGLCYLHIIMFGFDIDKSCCVPWKVANQQCAVCSGSPHNDQSFN